MRSRCYAGHQHGGPSLISGLHAQAGVYWCAKSCAAAHPRPRPKAAARREEAARRMVHPGEIIGLLQTRLLVNFIEKLGRAQ